MNPLTHIPGTILEKDIRFKIGVSALAALVGVGVFYFAFEGTEWFAKIDKRGLPAVAGTLVIVALATFLIVLLPWLAVAAIYGRRGSRRKDAEDVVLREKVILKTVQRMTPWQRQFVHDLVKNNTRQTQDSQSSWEPELEVLVLEGVIRESGKGMYEITPDYFQYIQDAIEKP
jgi:hypothetical protein